MSFDLRKRIMVPVAALILLSLGLATGATYILSRDAMIQAISTELQKMSQAKAELIGLWIDECKTAVRLSSLRAVYQAVAKQDSPEARQAASRDLAEQIKVMPSFNDFVVANDKGLVIAAALPEAVGKIKVDDREYFQQAIKGQVVVSNPVISRATNTPIFLVAAPLKDKEKILGVVFGAVDLAKFNEKFIDAAQVAKTGTIFVYDATGLTLAHRDKSLIMKYNISGEDFGKEMLKLKKGVLRYVFKNEERFTAIEPVPGLGWTVGAAAPAAEALATANKVSLTSVIIGGVGLLLTLAVLLLVVQRVIKPLRRIIASLSGGAQQVAAASSQVSGSSQLLAEGASEQAAALEETSSSLEEIASMTRTSADNTSQIDSLMGEAKRVVGRAGQDMSEMARSMSQIAEAGAQISKIVKTIDEIAFQTNLLALNAAVEAARAGEAGAGFAVVADEVRNLALRAAEAAKSTQGLIEETTTRINHGSVLVTQSQEGFGAVTDSASKVAALVGEVAAASHEQAQGIDQVTQAVGQMDQVIQRNAATAEESASAAQELSAQAAMMKNQVEALTKLVEGRVISLSAAGPTDREKGPKFGTPAQARPVKADSGRGAPQLTMGEGDDF